MAVKTMATIEDMAQTFAGFLTTVERKEGKRITVKTADAPEWVGEIIRGIHGDLLPDDWTYATIQECADYIAENGDDGEQPEADIYTHNLLQWLATYPNATDAVDEAVEEYGATTGIVQAIQYGQHKAIGEIHFALVAALTSLIEEMEEAE